MHEPLSAETSRAGRSGATSLSIGNIEAVTTNRWFVAPWGDGQCCPSHENWYEATLTDEGHLAVALALMDSCSPFVPRGPYR